MNELVYIRVHINYGLLVGRDGVLEQARVLIGRVKSISVLRKAFS